MIIDLLFLVVLLLFMIRGYRKGIIIALFSVVAVIVGAMAALKFSGLVAAQLFDAESAMSKWAPFLSYILVFLLVMWLIKLGANLLQKTFEAVALGSINRLAGALLYGFLVCFIFSTLFWLMAKIGIVNEDTANSSKVFPLMMPLAPKLFEWIGKVLPFVQTTFQELETFFQHMNEKISSHVATD